MKALLVTLMFPVLLRSCDGTPDQIGATPPPPPPAPRTNNTNNNGNTDDPNAVNAPIDGGIGILLIAGTAYGVRRYRNQKKP